MFGRDRLGRRSLLMSANPSSHFCLVSVGAEPGIIELPADGLYVLDLSDKTQLTRFRYPAVTDVEGHGEPFLSGLRVNNVEICSTPEHWQFHQTIESDRQEKEYVALVDEALERAISRRAERRKGQIGVLFSGGLDCSLVVYYLTKLIPNVPIHLFTVAFGKRELHLQWDTENSDSKNSEFFSKTSIRIPKFRSLKNCLSTISESNRTTLVRCDRNRLFFVLFTLVSS